MEWFSDVDQTGSVKFEIPGKIISKYFQQEAEEDSKVLWINFSDPIKRTKFSFSSN
jgi:hypothetical protein